MKNSYTICVFLILILPFLSSCTTPEDSSKVESLPSKFSLDYKQQALATNPVHISYISIDRAKEGKDFSLVRGVETVNWDKEGKKISNKDIQVKREISRDQVEKLYGFMKKKGFFDLEKKYTPSEEVDGGSRAMISVHYGEKKKTVVVQNTKNKVFSAVVDKLEALAKKKEKK